ncbi:MAG TPA: hypothetical protein VGE52_13710 [Pirellulales bacterium]
MSAERMNSDDSFARDPDDAALNSAELNRVEAELQSLRLGPSHVDRERLFFEAGRAAATAEPCDCATRIKRERGAWAVALAASVGLALWLPPTFAPAPVAATVERASPVATNAAVGQASGEAVAPHPGTTSPAAPGSAPSIASPAGVEGSAAPPVEDQNSARPAVPWRWSVAALSGAWSRATPWSEPPRSRDYLRVRNDVLARGLAVGLADLATSAAAAPGAGASGEPAAYRDLLKTYSEF